MDRLNAISSVTFKSKRYSTCLEIFKDIPAWFDGIHTDVFHHISETFIEPKVIPPFHSHEVPKPLVSQFMGHNKGNLLTASKCRVLIDNQVNFTVGHKTPVFHSTS
ncbi:Uncharacterised protein [Mycobacterium tuberculosis]|nr:Uncharacterised protein [Mycobacterium tuberculosis]